MMPTLFVLLLLLLKVHEAHIAKCKHQNPQPTLLSYHQSGDFIVGAIASQNFLLSTPVAFSEHPPDASEDSKYVCAFSPGYSLH